MPQDLSVNLLIDFLALWQELTVDNASHIEECDQHDFDFWLWLPCFLWPWQRQTFPLRALALGFPVVIKNPSLITSDDSSKQVWFILKSLNDVLTHLHATLLLVIIQQSWQHFCTDFLHAQIFSDNLPNTVLFYVQLTCNHSNSQLTIAMHSALPTRCSPEFCSLKASNSWSHLPPPCTPLWTSCATQKHVFMKLCYLHTLA